MIHVLLEGHCLYAAYTDFSKPSFSGGTGDTEKLLAFFILTALQTILHVETACLLLVSFNYCFEGQIISWRKAFQLRFWYTFYLPYLKHCLVFSQLTILKHWILMT